MEKCSENTCHVINKKTMENVFSGIVSGQGRVVFVKGPFLCFYTPSTNAMDVLNTEEIIGPGNDILTIKHHTDKDVIVISTLSKEVVVLEHADGKWTIMYRKSMPKLVTVLAFSHDSVYMADRSGDIHVLREFTDLCMSIRGHVSIVTDMYIDHASQYIYTADKSGEIRQLFCENPVVIRNMMFGHREYISVICEFLEQEIKHLLVSGGGDRHLCLWNVDSNPPILVQKYVLEHQSDKDIDVATIVPLGKDRRCVLVLEQIPEIRVLEVNNNRLVECQRISMSSPCTAAGFADNRLYAALESGEIAMFGYSGESGFIPENGPDIAAKTPQHGREMTHCLLKRNLRQTRRERKSSSEWFRSTDLGVMGPAR